MRTIAVTGGAVTGITTAYAPARRAMQALLANRGQWAVRPARLPTLMEGTR